MQNDTYRGFNGYVLESGPYRVLFGGDTAMTSTFAPLRSLGPIDLAIMPIGAYNRGFGCIAIRNRRCAWRMMRGRSLSCRFTIKRFS